MAAVTLPGAMQTGKQNPITFKAEPAVRQQLQQLQASTGWTQSAVIRAGIARLAADPQLSRPPASS